MFQIFQPFAIFRPFSTPNQRPSLFARVKAIATAIYDIQDLSTLFQDAAGTTPAEIGDPVGLVLDKSGNGYHATQSVSAARPILARTVPGGRRNLLAYTEDLSNALWVKPGGVSVSQDGTLDPSGNLAWKITFLATDATGSIEQYISSSSSSFKNSANILTTDIHLTLRGGSYLADRTITSVSPMSDWQEVRTDTFIGDEGFAKIKLRNAGELGSFYISAPQLELGTEATNYQKVASQYDVTEEGQPEIYYLAHDGIDDAISATLPDLGTDASEIYSNGTEIVTLENQTISGAYDITQGGNLYAGIITADTLTARQLADAQRYVTQRSGL